MPTGAFNDAAATYGPQNDAEKEMLAALSDGRAGRGTVFGATMKGASLSATNDKPGEEGWTPLMYAMKNHNDELIEFMLHNYADPDQRNREGDTALMVCLKNRRKDNEGNYNIEDFFQARKLIREYEDDPLCHINLQNRAGMTALSLAASLGQWDFALRILEAGADPYVEDLAGKTAIDYARAHPDAQSYSARGAVGMLEEFAAKKKAQEQHIADGMPATASVTVKRPLSFKK
jgi:ankyrin repeat protein